VHEPFGDAWYFGPERLSDRFEKNESARVKSGYSGTTYHDVFADIETQGDEVGPPPSSIMFDFKEQIPSRFMFTFLSPAALFFGPLLFMWSSPRRS
jgi:hypothetical protein